jgi:Fe2+ or Zn2+ uptake regulation protein
VRTPAELTDLFRERGLKVTAQREAVFRVLHANDRHPTAESVHAAVTAVMPSVSLRTVYGVLNDLAAMGEVLALDVGLGATRFDPNVDAHHHLVCTGCGKVRDVHAATVDLPEVDAFTIEDAEVVFRGRCDTCQ